MGYLGFLKRLMGWNETSFRILGASLKFLGIAVIFVLLCALIVAGLILLGFYTMARLKPT